MGPSLRVVIMDKRLVLAFVLIGLIILLTPKYQEWILGKREVLQPERSSPSPKSPSPQTEKEKARKVETQAPSSVFPQGGEQRDLPEREVVVENELFISRWTTRGGILKSWILKKYRDGLWGTPVELVVAGGAGGAVLVGGEDLSQIPFEPSQNAVSVKGNENATLTWVGRWKDGTVEKRITVSGNRYDMKIDIHLGGGLSEQKCGLEWRGGIGRTERHLEDELSHTKVITFMGGEVELWDVDEAKSTTSRPSGEGGWIGVRNKYFLVSFIPENEGRYGMRISGGQVQEGVKRFDFGLVAESRQGGWAGSVYGGPISYSIFKDYRPELQQAMTWGWEWSRGLMEPIGVGILKIFLTIHELVPNYGLVIILFSILVKIALNPLTHKSYEATAKMQEIQPQIAVLRDKYANDQQRMNQELMRLYKEQGVNPLGGCLPVVFQMPILFALFNVFQNAIELRQAHFVGWMDDLSQPDRLSVGGMQVHVLPILMALTMFFQQKMTVKDPKQMMMVYLMPVMMIFFFWSMSSGLVLYWTLFNLLSWGQQVVIQQVQKAQKG